MNDINRDVWLYILSVLDINDNQYWYMRGLLDVLLPEDKKKPFCNSPLVQYLYDIKLKSKSHINN